MSGFWSVGLVWFHRQLSETLESDTYTRKANYFPLYINSQYSILPEHFNSDTRCIGFFPQASNSLILQITDECLKIIFNSDT